MCVLSIASTASFASTEMFVIEADPSGHEAIVKIPVGAVTKMSANSAQTLEGYAGPQVEAMRLSGDVLISIAGSAQPIEIRADKVLVELTADFLPDDSTSARANAAPHKVLRSTGRATVLSGRDDSQVFVGTVVFDLQTTSGPMEIKADRVEHQLTIEAGA